MLKNAQVKDAPRQHLRTACASQQALPRFRKTVSLLSGTVAGPCSSSSRAEYSAGHQYSAGWFRRRALRAGRRRGFRTGTGVPVMPRLLKTLRASLLDASLAPRPLQLHGQCTACPVLSERCFEVVLDTAGHKLSVAQRALTVCLTVSVEPASGNSRCCYAGINISAPVESVWGALTDYERLGTFIPGVYLSLPYVAAQIVVNGEESGKLG